MKNSIQLKGRMEAVLKKKDGLTQNIEKDNMILNCGYEYLARCIISSERPRAMTKIAVGLGGGDTSAAQTGLSDSLAVKNAKTVYDKNSNNILFEAFFGSDVAGAIKEAGICTDNGIFLDRSTFDVMNKGAQDELIIKFYITLGGA